MREELERELITLSWLLPKCEYAVENCEDIELLKMRFKQLCNVNNRILKFSVAKIEQSEVTE